MENAVNVSQANVLEPCLAIIKNKFLPQINKTTISYFAIKVKDRFREELYFVL